MKKLAALFLVVILCLTFAACGDGTTSIDSTDGLSVEECFLGVIGSDSADELAEYICTNNADTYFQKVKQLFGDDSYSVEAEYSGKYKDYEVYYLTLKSRTDSSKQMSNFEIFKKQGDNYYLALDDATISEINTKCLCPTCGGTGTTVSGSMGNACGICAGTGTQYTPNAYYDATLGMWMGQYTACSGCAGSGHIGGTTTTNSCATCLGRRFVFEK